MTAYRVLRRLLDRAQPAYEPVCEWVEAASAKAAVRAAVHSLDPAECDGVYVAVPWRSWAELEVVLEQQPRLATYQVRRQHLQAVPDEAGPSPGAADAAADTRADVVPVGKTGSG